jgi:uncharacterized protein (DUF1810 family)
MSIERFVLAQAETYDQALGELKEGRKSGHWIWWVFPQLRGLGWSHNSTFYGLEDESEASDYLRHPILGSRYRECLAVAHGHLCVGGVDPLVLMGGQIDVLKLGSSLELFLKVAPAEDEVMRGQAAAVLARLRLRDSA